MVVLNVRKDSWRSDSVKLHGRSSNIREISQAETPCNVTEKNDGKRNRPGSDRADFDLVSSILVYLEV